MQKHATMKREIVEVDPYKVIKNRAENQNVPKSTSQANMDHYVDQEE